MSGRRFLLPAAVLLALASRPAAAAPASAIVNGEDADATTSTRRRAISCRHGGRPDRALRRHAGRHPPVPHRGALRRTTMPAPPEMLHGPLGDVDIAPTEQPTSTASADNEVNDTTTATGRQRHRDAHARPPGRRVRRDARRRRERDGLWAPGRRAAILGWGETAFGGDTSDRLRRARSRCGPMPTAKPRTSDFFDPRRWSARGAAAGRSSDTCQGDSGGPLLVPDGPASSRSPASSRGLVCSRAAAEPGHLRPHRRRPAQRLGAQPHARGRLRVRPRAARQRAGDADLDLAPSRGRRTTSRPSGGTSTTTAPSTTRRRRA